ncbi:hypothetical protein B0H16DRAFT_1308731 [Mycena metata]|uniref:Uncharacterized protein n=1 Tax=Mycena metata TaxID=1033252 RepID=A0AAD7JNT3_9AGAR|nr:hypothetical protein B0H16DRAFT_1328692 [Mycena metata]KAJ7767314.1 hypothetical protein B0H16DRAFT_1308731 [Mycena metata]
MPLPQNHAAVCSPGSSFADAYQHGLEGTQAAWAAREYKRHRVLPPKFLKAMEDTGIGRGGNVNVGL